MKTQTFRRGFILWSGVALFLLECTLAGCTLPNLQPDGKNVSCRDPGCKLWEEGMDAFQRGDYPEALDIFEMLNFSGGSERLCRKALYALACTRMILAEDSDEFREAMDLWDSWSQLTPPDTEDEDPRMLAPLFQYIVPPSTVEGDQQEDTASCDDEACRKVFLLKDKEIRNLKKRIRSLEALQHKAQDRKAKGKSAEDAKSKNKLPDEIKEYQRRLKAKEREILRLKSQIESLEAIHRNIQEKKKKATSQ